MVEWLALRSAEPTRVKWHLGAPVRAPPASVAAERRSGHERGARAELCVTPTATSPYDVTPDHRWALAGLATSKAGWNPARLRAVPGQSEPAAASSFNAVTDEAAPAGWERDGQPSPSSSRPPRRASPLRYGSMHCSAFASPLRTRVGRRPRRLTISEAERAWPATFAGWAVTGTSADVSTQSPAS
jgi:hypothetical protein